VLAKFLHRTAEPPDTIHVHITGRLLEVYTSGTHAMPIGGLAYRGSDALVISATPGSPVAADRRALLACARRDPQARLRHGRRGVAVSIRGIGASPDVHMLVGAVEKKVKRRR
jgi:hypothetical protein